MSQKFTNAKIGNTKRFSPERCRNWFFTFNNYKETDIEVLLAQKSDYVFQEEKGENGTKHLQGVMSWKNAKRFDELKKLCEGKIHWERCRSIKHAKEYCSKIKTRNGRQWCKGFSLPKPVYDIIDIKGPMEWQKRVINMVCRSLEYKFPDDRSIYWFWNKNGNKGKTALSRHLVLKYGAIVLGGTHKDAFYAIAEKIKKKEEVNIVVFDIPRSMENRISYIALEKIKDGLLFSSKYESSMLIFNPPIIIVFSNFECDKEKLSLDRWKIEEIK